MVIFKYLKNLQWYNAVGYVLNKAFVGQHATAYLDLKYGQHQRQVLDLYVPHQARSDKALIVFVHGGSWQRGQKEDYIFLAQNLAKDGFYVALLNYQLAPENIFPVFVNDTVLAVNWLQNSDQIQAFGYNPNKLILKGHSAGAFNVLSAIYSNESTLKIANLSGIYGVIGIAGPYSFEHRGDPVAGCAFPQNLTPEVVMPNHFVYPNKLRHLLLLASNDTLVEESNTEKMAIALQEVGNHVQVAHISYTQHISIIATLAKGVDRWFNTKKIILSFIGEDS